MGFRFEGFLKSPVIGSLYSVVRKEGFGGIKKAGWEVKKSRLGRSKPKGRWSTKQGGGLKKQVGGGKKRSGG